jgi:hypothetical protein
MAWGLTSKYSHDEKQNTVGEFFMKEIKAIFDSYRTIDKKIERAARAHKALHVRRHGYDKRERRREEERAKGKEEDKKKD